VTSGHLRDAADEEANEQRLDHSAARQQGNAGRPVGQHEPEGPGREHKRNGHDRRRIWTRHDRDSCIASMIRLPKKR